jgi:hypothetical protein
MTRAQDVRRKTIETIIGVLDDTAWNAVAIVVNAPRMRGVTPDAADILAVEAAIREMRDAIAVLLTREVAE